MLCFPPHRWTRGGSRCQAPAKRESPTGDSQEDALLHPCSKWHSKRQGWCNPPPRVGYVSHKAASLTRGPAHGPEDGLTPTPKGDSGGSP